MLVLAQGLGGLGLRRLDFKVLGDSGFGGCGVKGLHKDLGGFRFSVLGLSAGVKSLLYQRDTYITSG